MLNLPILFEFKQISVYLLPNKQYLLWDGREYTTCEGIETVLLFIQHQLDGTEEDLPF